jgi:primosomal protein N' (replication factor Y) (superfamily II helicase)
VKDHNFPEFYRQELETRRELNYPPFSRLVLVETSGTNEDAVRQTAEQIGRALHRESSTLTVLGPAPAVIGKINKMFRWHIIIKNSKADDPSSSRLRGVLRKALGGQARKRNVRVAVDVDPAGLM